MADVVTPTTASAAPAAQPAPGPRPGPVHLEIGWVRDADDPTAAVLQLTRLAEHGPTAQATVDAVLGRVDALLSCGTDAIDEDPRQPSFQIRVRGPDAPDDDPIRIDVQPTEAEALARCIDAAVRSHVTTPARGDVAVFSFRVFADRDAATLRRARDDRLVAVRDAGTCWQWETYPCAPHKHCRAPEFIRTSCGEPAMRDDVTLRWTLGNKDASGRAAPTGIELVAGDGATVWATALSEAAQRRYGSRFAIADAPIEIRPRATAFAVSLGVVHVIVADAAGVHVFERRTGDLVAQWLAPPREEPAMQFDGGEVSIRRRGKTCRADAGQGRFFVACDDRWIWFDGHTMAVLQGDAVGHLATKTVGERGAKLTGGTLTPALTVRAAGVTVDVTGQIFVQ